MIQLLNHGILYLNSNEGARNFRLYCSLSIAVTVITNSEALEAIALIEDELERC